MSVGPVHGAVHAAPVPERHAHPEAQQERPGDGPAAVVELSDEAREQVAALQARDAVVRAHEAAHVGAGGGLASGATFTYETGPDGRQYAVGGEVRIQTGGGGTPQERIAQAQQVRRAALAPAQPSSQDRAVAATASRAEAAALAELAAERAEESGEGHEVEEGSGLPAPEGHAHSEGGCGFCSRAAEAYRDPQL